MFEWNGSSVVTNGDIMSIIAKVTTAEEAQEFMVLALASNPHARENIGYLAGYFDSKTKHRIFSLFGVEHPIFGKLDPTNIQAMACGIAHGMAKSAGGAKEFVSEIFAMSDEAIIDKWLKGRQYE